MITKARRAALLALVLPFAACVAAPVEEESDNAQTSPGDTGENNGEAQQAISNVTLTQGQTATFPTWCCWGWTTVRITNNGANYGCVNLQVGGASETLCATPGAQNWVVRQWWGVNLQVTNNYATTFNVEVW